MSTILADTVRKTGGTLGVDIRIKNNSVYESDGGTSTTQNIVQSLVKVWAKFNGSSFGELDSFNVSSFTDSGTGNYTVNINNDFSNANHASIEGSGAYHTVNDAANAAGTLNLACYNSSHSNADESRVAVYSCGDLA